MKNFWKTLNKPIIGLAPMDGITDFPMRQIQTEIAKPDVMYTEFVSVEGYVRKPEKFKKPLTYKENEHPIVAQVFGAVPEDFENAVQKIAKMGFDGIDINMGCPARTVVQRGAGGDLIGNYDLAEKIISGCLRGIEKSPKDIPLSVKTRIGKDKIITKEWISFLSQYPLAEITIHGRLLIQSQGGLVNWEEIGLASVIAGGKNIICLGNGGIKSLTEVKEKCQKYGLDGVLIGTAALGNPWFFREEDKLTKDEIFQTLLKHAKLIEEFHGEKGYVTGIKHFCWYLKGIENARDIRNEIVKTRNAADLENIIKKYYPHVQN